MSPLGRNPRRPASASTVFTRLLTSKSQRTEWFLNYCLMQKRMFRELTFLRMKLHPV